MGWICGGCGKYGHREGATAVDATDKAANWCVRQGTASMSGVNMCCICRPSTGHAFACNNCRRQMGLKKLDQPSVQTDHDRTEVPLVRWAIPKRMQGVRPTGSGRVRPTGSGQHSTSPVHSARVVSEKAKTMAKIAVFDFDHVLFRTPEKPSWFPLKGACLM